MTHIDDLPDEMILQIAHHLRRRIRNQDLINLSLVSRRFRGIAQEQLLCEPRFDLANIHAFLWQLCHKSWFMSRIHSIELKSTSKERYSSTEVARDDPTSPRFGLGLSSSGTYPAIACPPEILAHPEFLQTCKAVINCNAKSGIDRKQWKSALRTDIVPALLGILLVMLPNLKVLRLAATWLMDFPIFSGLLSGEVTTWYPLQWDHEYLDSALTHLQSNLEILDFPTDSKYLSFYTRPRALFDFRSFLALRELSVPVDAIYYYTRQTPPVEPTDVLPPTLELLRISEAHQFTANFINSICLAKKRGHFPVLRRIELYYYTGRELLEIMADQSRCPNPVSDVRRMCVDAEIGLFVYFPSHKFVTPNVGESLWALREEGVLEQVEDQAWEKWMGCFGVPEVRWDPYESTWDAEGDVVME